MLSDKYRVDVPVVNCMFLTFASRASRLEAVRVFLDEDLEAAISSERSDLTTLEGGWIRGAWRGEPILSFPRKA